MIAGKVRVQQQTAWRGRSILRAALITFAGSGAVLTASLAPVHAAGEGSAGDGQVVVGAIPRNPEPVDTKTEISSTGRAAPAFSVQNAAGEDSMPLPLSIQIPQSGGVQYTFVMLKGLPPGFKASAGFATRDAWVVSVNDVRRLNLLPPAGFRGQFALEVLLVKGVDAPPESRRALVTIHPAAQQVQSIPAPQPAVAVMPAVPDNVGSRIADAPRPAAPPVAGMPAGEERAGMDRAEQLLKNSDIAAARLLFESMALRGSAKAAFAMGQTFDPEFLGTLTVKGLKPDVEQAKQWYRKALELGSTEARGRLSALR